MITGFKVNWGHFESTVLPLKIIQNSAFKNIKTPRVNNINGVSAYNGQFRRIFIIPFKKMFPYF
jgi:hypothetical protein